MFQEWYERGRDAHHLFRRHVHVLDLLRSSQDKVSTVATRDGFRYQPACSVQFRVGLGNDVFVTLDRREKLHFISHTSLNDFPIRRLNESELVDPRVGCQRCNQSDIGAFRRLDRTNTTVVRRMHVSNFEPGPLSREPAWTKSRQTPFMRDFSQWVRLVHELRQLAAAEKLLNGRHNRFGIDQVMR